MLFRSQLGAFLGDVDSALGGTLSAFEVMWQDFYKLISDDSTRHQQPLPANHRYYVLLESTGGHQETDKHRFEASLEQAFEKGLIVDAVVAQSKQQREALWSIRDDIDGMTQKLYPPLVFDISLGIQDMEDYVSEVRARLLKRWPDSKMVAFGHLGDGNIHLVVSIGSLEPEDVHAAETIIYDALGKRNGIVSAEHGIGLDKREYLKHSRSEVELALMKSLKKAMDPNGILNPGKIFT